MINWVLVASFGFRPYSLSDKIVYFGIGVYEVDVILPEICLWCVPGPLVTFPIPFAVIYDWRRASPKLYIAWVSAAVWIW